MKAFSVAAAKPKDHAAAASCLPNVALSTRDAITSRLCTTGGSATTSSRAAATMSRGSAETLDAPGMFVADACDASVSVGHSGDAAAGTAGAVGRGAALWDTP